MRILEERAGLENKILLLHKVFVNNPFGPSKVYAPTPTIHGVRLQYYR